MKNFISQLMMISKESREFHKMIVKNALIDYGISGQIVNNQSDALAGVRFHLVNYQ